MQFLSKETKLQSIPANKNARENKMLWVRRKKQKAKVEKIQNVHELSVERKHGKE